MDAISGIEAAAFSGPPVSLISGMPGGLILFRGDAALSHLSSRLISWRLAMRERVLFIDGDNRFNPYPIANLAKRIGRDPGTFLSSIFISRAFTCHQMSSLITRQLGDGIARHRPRLVLLAEPLATFYDESIPHLERKTLLSRAVAALARSAREGTWIVMLASAPSSRKQALLFSMIHHAAQRVFSVQTDEKEILIREETGAFGNRAPQTIGRR